MGKKQEVIEPNPKYMGCAAQIVAETREDVVSKIQPYEIGGYCAEEKLDGQWCEVTIEKGLVKRIVSRGGCSKPFQPLIDFRFRPDLNGVLTGEMGYGSSNPTMQQKIFVIYDFDWMETKDDRWVASRLSCRDRRAALEEVAPRTDKVHLVERRMSNFLKYYDEVLERGDEGIIIKKLDGPETFYRPGTRSEHQIKLKKSCDCDMVVMGVEWRDPAKMSKLTKDKGMEHCIEGILVGLHFNGVLKKVEQVGSMTDEAREWFTDHVKEAESCTLIVVIHGWGQFPSGAIRHPSIKTENDGTFLRDDISVKDCAFGKIRYI